MSFLILFACTILAAWLLRKPIRKAAWVFYLIAIALDALLFANQFMNLPLWATSFTSFLMQKGGLAVSLFLLVMWIGVFPRTGKLSGAFRPIRAELSIMACILICGHMCVYLASYVPRLLSGGAFKTATLAAFIVACLLLVLVLLLGVTSFRFVKKHMKAHTWKKLQSLAYVFYALVLVHLLLMIGPSALSGSTRGVTMTAIYVILFGGYIVARIIRAVIDKKNKIDLAETVKDQGFVE